MIGSSVQAMTVLPLTALFKHGIGKGPKLIAPQATMKAVAVPGSLPLIDSR